MGRQGKKPGIKDIMAMAKAAETGISEQKKQEIFGAVRKNGGKTEVIAFEQIASLNGL